jgi:hypothetical protein
MQHHLQERLADTWSSFRVVKLVWDEAMLAEMIRQRVYVAVSGEFDSLGKVSAIPAVQDLELELARAVQPLPREMLKLVNQVLLEYEQRWQRNPKTRKQIEPQDIERAARWYSTEPVVEYLASSKGITRS